MGAAMASGAEVTLPKTAGASIAAGGAHLSSWAALLARLGVGVTMAPTDPLTGAAPNVSADTDAASAMPNAAQARNALASSHWKTPIDLPGAPIEADAAAVSAANAAGNAPQDVRTLQLASPPATVEPDAPAEIDAANSSSSKFVATKSVEGKPSAPARASTSRTADNPADASALAAMVAVVSAPTPTPAAQPAAKVAATSPHADALSPAPAAAVASHLQAATLKADLHASVPHPVVAPSETTSDTSASAQPAPSAPTLGSGAQLYRADTPAPQPVLSHPAAAPAAHHATLQAVAPRAEQSATIAPTTPRPEDDTATAASSLIDPTASQTHRTGPTQPRIEASSDARSPIVSVAAPASLPAPVAAPAHAAATSNADASSVAPPVLTPAATVSALDSADAGARISWTHASPQHAEASIDDPVLGMVSVRAQSDASGVHASIVPVSQDAALSLSTHLAGLHAYLAERHSGVDSVQVTAPDNSMTGFNNASQDSQQSGAGAQSSSRDTHAFAPQPATQASPAHAAHAGAQTATASAFTPASGHTISVLA